MLGRSRIAVFSQWFVVPVGRKVGSLKRRVRSHVAREDQKNCTPLLREAHFKVKMLKKLTVSEHFWKFRCRKIARRCSEKHICNSKCTRHTTFGPLFEVRLFKNGTPLWREAHLQVKIKKKHEGFGPLFEVQMWKNCGNWHVQNLHAAVAQSTFATQNVQNTPCSRDFFEKRWLTN